ncbi:MAG: carboxypeptidase-like regulatory domain-containing protein [Bacteroidota bacterium]
MKLLFSISILFGLFVAFSCEKIRPADLQENQPVLLATGGNDDDDPIIQGYVKNDQATAIIGADVYVHDAELGVIAAQTLTDANGYFEMQVDSGDYSIEVAASGYSTYHSGSFALESNISFSVVLE